MIQLGPDHHGIGPLAGQIIEYLELQKELGRKFLSWSEHKPVNLKPLNHQSEPFFESLGALAHTVIRCRQCPSFIDRSRPVPGQGSLTARLMFIGIAPGEEDDQQGHPFSGPKGDLLTKMIQAIHLSGEEVYLTHIIKCRPPGDRSPSPEEIAACGVFLKEEIRLVDPQIIVALGDRAAQTLSRTNKKMADLRGRWLTTQGRRLMAIYHPAFLLENPGAKREAWEDLKKIRRMYDEPANK